MKASRELTQAAFRIFLNHFLSFPWLRKYVVDARICDCLAEFRLDYEEYAQMYGNYDFDTLHSSQYILDASYHLMFLTRLASQWFPTAELLSKIDQTVRLLQTPSSKHQFVPGLDTIYFLAESSLKARESKDPDGAKLWSKIASVPVRSEAFYRYYVEAKGREMSLLRRCEDNKDFLENFFPRSETSVVENWMTADASYRKQVEKRKSLEDLMKYCESISTQERNNGFASISYFWDEFIRKERTGEYDSARDLLMAWALQKARDCSLRADKDGSGKPLELIWNFTISCLEKGANRKSSNLVLETTRLARRTEEMLYLFRVAGVDLERIVNHTPAGEIHPSIVQVQQETEKLIELLRKKILSPLTTVNHSTVKDLHITVDITAKFLPRQLLEVLKMFRTVVERKQQLVFKFTEFPPLVDILETKFHQFLDDLHKFLVYFQQKVRNLQSLNSLESLDFRSQFPGLASADGENGGVSHGHLFVDDFPFFDCTEMKDYCRKATAAEESEEFQLQKTTADGDERISSVYAVIMKNVKETLLTALCGRSPSDQKKFVEDSQVYWNQIRVILALPENHHSNEKKKKKNSNNPWERKIVNEFLNLCFLFICHCVNWKVCVDNIGSVTEKLILFLSDDPDSSSVTCTESTFLRWRDMLRFLGNVRLVGESEHRIQQRIFGVSFCWFEAFTRKSDSLVSFLLGNVEERRLLLESAVQHYQQKRMFLFYLTLIKEALFLEGDWLQRQDSVVYEELSQVELTEALQSQKDFQGLLKLLHATINNRKTDSTSGKTQFIFRCLLHACHSVVIQQSAGMLKQWKILMRGPDKYKLPALEEYLEIVLLVEKSNWGAIFQKFETLADFCHNVGAVKYPPALEAIRMKIKALLRKSAEVTEEIRDLKRKKSTDERRNSGEKHCVELDPNEMKHFVRDIRHLALKLERFICRGLKAYNATAPEIIAKEKKKQEETRKDVEEMLAAFPKLKEIVGDDPLI